MGVIFKKKDKKVRVSVLLKKKNREKARRRKINLSATLDKMVEEAD
jgi:post-segregation antitoxin (ccd killing protein)